LDGSVLDDLLDRSDHVEFVVSQIRESVVDGLWSARMAVVTDDRRASKRRSQLAAEAYDVRPTRNQC
jgi:hypothetical protein